MCIRINIHGVVLISIITVYFNYLTNERHETSRIFRVKMREEDKNNDDETKYLKFFSCYIIIFLFFDIRKYDLTK